MRRQAQFLHPASEKGNTSGIFLNYTLGTTDRLLMKMGATQFDPPRTIDMNCFLRPEEAQCIKNAFNNRHTKTKTLPMCAVEGINGFQP